MNGRGAMIDAIEGYVARVELDQAEARRVIGDLIMHARVLLAEADALRAAPEGS